MAIDSRAKRQSATWANFYLPATPLPSGTINEFQRQTVTNVYGGISTAPVGGSSDDLFLLMLVH